MHVYDKQMPNGLHFHVSFNNGACYIIVKDIYSEDFEMKYFRNLDEALDFINLL